MVRLFADIVWTVQNGSLQFMKKTCDQFVVIVWFNWRLCCILWLALIVMQRKHPTEKCNMYRRHKDIKSKAFSIWRLRLNDWWQEHVFSSHSARRGRVSTNDQNMCSRLILSVVVACSAFWFSSTTGTQTRWAARDENTCTLLIYNKRTVTKIKGIERPSSVSYRGKLFIGHSILSTFWPPRWLT